VPNTIAEAGARGERTDTVTGCVYQKVMRKFDLDLTGVPSGATPIVLQLLNGMENDTSEPGFTAAPPSPWSPAAE
jgi:hypothetical protein